MGHCSSKIHNINEVFYLHINFNGIIIKISHNLQKLKSNKIINKTISMFMDSTLY
jgi:hypothetical protein